MQPQHSASPPSNMVPVKHWLQPSPPRECKGTFRSLEWMLEVAHTNTVLHDKGVETIKTFHGPEHPHFHSPGEKLFNYFALQKQNPLGQREHDNPHRGNSEQPP